VWQSRTAHLVARKQKRERETDEQNIDPLASASRVPGLQAWASTSVTIFLFGEKVLFLMVLLS
jgi:hypothetical protein